MKAVVYNTKKSSEKLVYCDVDKPVPADNQVLIKVYAVSVNAADYRSMKMGLIPVGKIFGADIAGRIESVGKNVVQFKPGDEVVGDLAENCYILCIVHLILTWIYDKTLKRSQDNQEAHP